MSDVPEIPVDEALALFLALAFPNGLPEGIDRAQLVEQMLARIAEDRPEWAQQAQQPDIPSDPHERYLEERRREADEHREQRREEARVEAARAEIVRKLAAKRREAAASVPKPSLEIGPEPPVIAPSRQAALAVGIESELQLGAPEPGPLGAPEVGKPFRLRVEV
ncbi:MAG TPA: hypothetical protein VFR31_04870 [Thermoanaerobaculia bacterium]|nr:hypothetical protein [Thermoanaerobaculia bacterium]